MAQGLVSLRMDATAEGDPPQSIALSPPSHRYVCVLLIGQGLPKHLLKTGQYPCEPDGSVDLGAHGLHPGFNTLQIYQHRDYSDRAFVIVLHHPTAAQLAELQRLRNQDRSCTA